jgi:hypothetical protein
MLCNVPLHLQSCCFDLLISSGRIVTLLAMPPAWVDFSWAMMRGKRDNVKQISFIVIVGSWQGHHAWCQTVSSTLPTRTAVELFSKSGGNSTRLSLLTKNFCFVLNSNATHHCHFA